MPKTRNQHDGGSEKAGAADQTSGRPSVAEATETPTLHAALVSAGLVTDRPTLAANAGTDLNRKLLRAFEAADVSSAQWLRLPAPRTRCRLSSLSRTTLCELIERRAIRAIKVRQPGAQRGVVLINRQSLVDHLRRLEAEQCGEADADGGKA